MEKDEYIQSQLDLAERNMKVMLMQDTMNDLLKEHFGARVMFAGVKNYIPDMSQAIREHPRYNEFCMITIDDFLRVWPGIVRMKPWDLKTAITGLDAEIIKAKDVLEGTVDDPSK